MSIKCQNCGAETEAVVKDIRLDGLKVSRPVFYCSVCEMSLPVKGEDKYTWVDDFEWVSSIIYGLERSSHSCLGCNSEGIMIASTEHMLGNHYFPFHVEQMPSWQCLACGFEDRCRKEDRYLWADVYHLWV